MNIEGPRCDWLRLAAASLLGVVAVLSAAAAGEAEQAGTPPCRRITFEGKHYIACSIDVRRFEIRLAWRGERSAPFGSLRAYLQQLPPADKSRLQFAMNAGMYEPDLSPVGLLIERGKEQAAPNTRSGTGNFYWKPNGVFFAGEGKVGILDTAQFLKTRPGSDHATQSGPILVKQGTIGSRMLASTNSQNIRNGVGVRDESTAIFVISEDAVSFAEFAKLFRDALSCPDALYLDGSISQLYAPSVGRTDQGGVVGPVVAAFSRPRPAPAK